MRLLLFAALICPLIAAQHGRFKRLQRPTQDADYETEMPFTMKADMFDPLPEKKDEPLTLTEADLQRELGMEGVIPRLTTPSPPQSPSAQPHPEQLNALEKEKEEEEEEKEDAMPLPALIFPVPPPKVVTSGYDSDTETTTLNMAVEAASAAATQPPGSRPQPPGYEAASAGVEKKVEETKHGYEAPSAGVEKEEIVTAKPGYDAPSAGVEKGEMETAKPGYDSLSAGVHAVTESAKAAYDSDSAGVETVTKATKAVYDSDAAVEAVTEAARGYDGESAGVQAETTETVEEAETTTVGQGYDATAAATPSEAVIAPRMEHGYSSDGESSAVSHGETSSESPEGTTAYGEEARTEAGSGDDILEKAISKIGKELGASESGTITQSEEFMAEEEKESGSIISVEGSFDVATSTSTVQPESTMTTLRISLPESSGVERQVNLVHIPTDMTDAPDSSGVTVLSQSNDKEASGVQAVTPSSGNGETSKAIHSTTPSSGYDKEASAFEVDTSSEVPVTTPSPYDKEASAVEVESSSEIPATTAPSGYNPESSAVEVETSSEMPVTTTTMPDVYGESSGSAGVSSGESRAEFEQGREGEEKEKEEEEESGGDESGHDSGQETQEHNPVPFAPTRKNPWVEIFQRQKMKKHNGTKALRGYTEFCPPPRVCQKGCAVSINEHGCQDCQCQWLSARESAPRSIGTSCDRDADCPSPTLFCDLSVSRCQCKEGYIQDMKSSGQCKHDPLFVGIVDENLDSAAVHGKTQTEKKPDAGIDALEAQKASQSYFYRRVKRAVEKSFREERLQWPGASH